MINISNNFNKWGSLNIESVPQFTNIDLKDLKKYAPIIEIPHKESLSLNRQVQHLNVVDKKIANAKEHSNYHKKLSLALLATSVAIIAATVLVAVIVNPIPAVIIGPILCLIPAVFAAATIEELIVNFYMADSILPIIPEIIYIYHAFNCVKNLEEYRTEKAEEIEKTVNNFRLLLTFKDGIRQALQQELQDVDVMNLDKPFDPQHVAKLRRLLNELAKAETLINMIDAGTTQTV